MLTNKKELILDVLGATLRTLTPFALLVTKDKNFPVFVRGSAEIIDVLRSVLCHISAKS